MRLANRVLALVVAVALVVFAVLFTIEVVARVTDNGPVLIHWDHFYAAGRRNVWDDTGPRIISSVLVAIGAILVLLQLKPRRVSRYPLRGQDPTVDAAVSRRGMSHILSAAATGIDGVTAARTTVRGGRAVISARIAARGRDHVVGIRQEVEAAVKKRLTEMALRRELRVTIRVRQGRDSP
ncbi:MAG: DUF6286 domain-containing protein [Frankia sp.]